MGTEQSDRFLLTKRTQIGPETERLWANAIGDLLEFMGTDEQSADATPQAAMYKAVVNLEGQYALWPTDRDNAPGWSDAGPDGSEEDVLAQIATAWTNMIPLSARLPAPR